MIATSLLPQSLHAATPMPPFVAGQHAYTFTTTLKDKAGKSQTAKIDYLLFLPADYGKDKNKRWPALLFLHGSGESGSDVMKVTKHGPPMLVQTQPDFPFIVISPQASSPSGFWQKQLLVVEAMLDDLKAKLAIDPNRISLTGLSMGGFGAFMLAVDRPGDFAAVVPIAGGYYGNDRNLCAIKDVPTWIFHGEQDETVPAYLSQLAADALTTCGGKPKLTLYKDANHRESWQRAYNDPALWAWLLAQHRGK